MRLIKNVILPLLAIAVTAVPAAAEFTEASSEAAIEVALDSPPVSQLTQFLDDHNQSGLSESVLARHIRAALRVNGPMSGSYDGAGSEIALLVGDREVAVFNQRHPGNGIALQTAEEVGPGNLSLTAAASSGAHTIGSGYVSSASPQVVNSSGSSFSAPAVVLDGNPIAPSNTNQSQVPLPPAALLFASGLAGLPLTRRLRRS